MQGYQSHNRCKVKIVVEQHKKNSHTCGELARFLSNFLAESGTFYRQKITLFFFRPVEGLVIVHRNQRRSLLQQENVESIKTRGGAWVEYVGGRTWHRFRCKNHMFVTATALILQRLLNHFFLNWHFLLQLLRVWHLFLYPEILVTFLVIILFSFASVACEKRHQHANSLRQPVDTLLGDAGTTDSDISVQPDNFWKMVQRLSEGGFTV